MAKKTGAGTSSTVEYSPNRQKRMAKKRVGQEEKWARRSGAVVTYRVGEEKPELPLPKQRRRPSQKSDQHSSARPTTSPVAMSKAEAKYEKRFRARKPGQCFICKRSFDQGTVIFIDRKDKKPCHGYLHQCVTRRSVKRKPTLKILRDS
jgi:hypothetical protein